MVGRDQLRTGAGRPALHLESIPNIYDFRREGFKEVRTVLASRNRRTALVSPMANETILVVDDAPVNLKLTDILLRKEGYKVHTTSDAEQALSRSVPSTPI